MADRNNNSILFVANSAWNLVNFRAPIISALKSRGFNLHAATPPDGATEELRELGVELHPISVDSRGLSPIADAALVLRYRALCRQVRPAVVLAFTAKPNIYGSMAAAALGIPVINTITGLGTGFLKGQPLETILGALYRRGLRASARTFFHNEDDRDLLLSRKIVTPAQARVVPGSGVDTQRFAPMRSEPLKNADGPVTFLYIGRLLKTKGAMEFAQAATILNGNVTGRFQMLGPIEAPPDAISPEVLQPLVQQGVIELLGKVPDVRPAMASADCIVLPSYREGMPRVILEASAMGLPVIATDVPGCRQAVDHGVTGFLCEARSSNSLAEAMRKMAELPVEERLAMGQAGREKVIREFSTGRVVSHYLDALGELGLC